MNDFRTISIELEDGWLILWRAALHLNNTGRNLTTSTADFDAHSIIARRMLPNEPPPVFHFDVSGLYDTPGFPGA